MNERIRFSLMIAWMCGSACASSVGHGAIFSPPERITDGARKYQLSRTANHLMAFDSSGTMHITYWSGRLATTPATPSYIYYRAWTPAGGWSAPLEIDDSIVSGSQLGGRHPTLALMPDDTVWIAWHDHRHCTAAGNWIDNAEVYADFKSPGGAFLSGDLRLTTSVAPHNGDNAYNVRFELDRTSNTLNMVWYDFNLNKEVADIYLKTSLPGGVFDPLETMSSMRATDLASRGDTPSFTVPDLAIDSAGTRHLAWAGGGGADADLYYAAVPRGVVAASPLLLAAGGTDFYDPPHLAAAPSGDVWLAYGDDATAAGENIVLLRRRESQPGFDPRITVTNASARQYSPDHEIDPLGRVHLVWIDERSGRHLYYGIYDPSVGGLVVEQPVTSVSGLWIRPTIALDVHGAVHILFEQDTNAGLGDVWFTTTSKPNSIPRGIWSQYE